MFSGKKDHTGYQIVSGIEIFVNQCKIATIIVMSVYQLIIEHNPQNLL